VWDLLSETTRLCDQVRPLMQGTVGWERIKDLLLVEHHLQQPVPAVACLDILDGGKEPSVSEDDHATARARHEDVHAVGISYEAHFTLLVASHQGDNDNVTLFSLSTNK
jgi:hypothetical protein